MPLIATRGAASAQGFGEFAQSAAPTYIEDVFSTYLYTGNGSTQTITNGIDLSTKGGLVWTKDRTVARGHVLIDTVRGGSEILASNTTGASSNFGSPYLSFASTGYNIVTSDASVNGADNYVSWTFREQPKFFDVVTYTGDGNASRQIAHSLNSTPGCIIIKCTSNAQPWTVYHRSLEFPYYLRLNETSAQISDSRYFPSSPTSTYFVPGGDYNDVNRTGYTYVAYLFAHDAGGFGLTGSDNVISCGSYTGNGSATGPVVTLGYEPQWVLVKNASTAGDNWLVFDTMRGMSFSTSAYLRPNTTDPESIGTGWIIPQATGFQLGTTVSSINGSGQTYIYIAIRRGPMKTPTSGTSVFSPVARSGNSTNTTVAGSSGVSDLAIIKNRNTVITQTPFWASRLTANNFLLSSATDAQSTAGTAALQSNPWDVMSGIKVGTGGAVTVTNASGQEYINYLFTRAPGFFDVVCYSGTSAARTVSHNLGVAPELMIVKARSGSLAGNINWFVYAAPLGNSSRLLLDTTGASADGQTVWNNTTPTSSVFSLGTSDNINGSGYTYVAYLFASVTGISKVGSYTGTGTTKQIDCGFTGGARWVMIKRTDSTGDWYVWDSARGIVAGNDPYLLLNSTAAEVTNTDYVDTYSAGFEISSTAPAAINANGGTFIFLAIA